MSKLLSDDLLKKFTYLEYHLGKLRAGKRKGEHVSPQKGGSVEFSEHRSYVPGDDLRYLDWNVFARHGEPYVKEFESKEDIHLVLLLDSSRSMDFGDPNRFRYASRLTLALAYAAFTQYDSCSVFSLQDETAPVIRQKTGSDSIYPLAERLEEISCSGGCNLQSFRQMNEFTGSRRNILMFFLSDFYDLKSIQQFYKRLAGLHIRFYSIQLMTPQELHPDLDGVNLLEDMETGETLEMQITEGDIEAYRENLEEHTNRIRNISQRYGLGYLRFVTDMPLVDSVVRMFQKYGVMQ